MGDGARSSVVRCACVFVIVGGLSIFCQAGVVGGNTTSDDADRSRAQYQQWVARYSQPLNGLKLVITVPDEGASNRLVDLNVISVNGCRVSADGKVSYFSFDERGARGSGDEPITSTNLKRLDALLEHLPDDDARLPPPGRRLLLQASNGQRQSTRVYDRANVPDRVLEILRLSHSRILPWTLKIDSESEIDSGGDGGGGLLCLSPDSRTILFASGSGPMQLWEPVTHETLGDTKRLGIPADEIRFSPDGTWAMVAGFGECGLFDTKTWTVAREFEEPWIHRTRLGLDDPQFTPDGKYLVLQSSEPSLRVFDTHTWQPVAALPDVPGDAIQYFPAPKSRRAILRFKGGSISLWDVDRHLALSRLDRSCYVQDVTFSPDESVMAIVTADRKSGDGYWGHPRLRLWDAKTGTFIRELWPMEQTTSERIKHLVWSPDGNYLVAACEADGGWMKDICLWNANSGRCRATFAGCDQGVTGLVLMPDGGELLAGGSDGKIQFWDFRSAVKQIREFEDSLFLLARQTF
jgi:WD40 repeat protein